jgi:queuine tRNA-ribosyltransferase
MIPFRFELLHTRGPAGLRRGRIHTPHGTVETPCFAPVGTAATVKGLLPRLVAETGSEMLLCNAYHLFVRPGAELIRELGGLHRFMGWSRPILTDSGGYQVFSMADRCRIDEDGVTFASFVDGRAVRLTPEVVLAMQRDLGPDIAMVLDQCARGDAAEPEVLDAHHRTLRWARTARDLHDAWGGAARGQAVFGIVQGGTRSDLRDESARALAALDFDGYAVGGLSVGESKEATWAALAAATVALPEHKVRYLMGVGTPADFVAAVHRGVDLFDCVTPTRHGRNAQAFTRQGRLNLRNARYARDPLPLDPECRCETCRTASRGYLRHLFQAGEMLAGILTTLHNITYFQDVMRGLRAEAEQPA